MAAVIHLPYSGEMFAGECQPRLHAIANGFEYFPETLPPNPTQELVNTYNRWMVQGGQQEVFKRQPEVKREHGLSFACFGESTKPDDEEPKLLIVAVNPFATDLQPHNLLFGQFIYDSLKAHDIVGPDGRTPQVIQFAAPSRHSDIPLNFEQHKRVAEGHVEPITDKIAEVVFEKFPKAEQVIGIGFSASAFLEPDLLLSLSRDKEVLAGLMANMPGVEPQPMPAILKKFSHAGAHMAEHLLHSGLQILEPKTIIGLTAKIREKAHTVTDVVWRPTNLSLWRAFSRGQFLERVQTLHERIPSTVISIAFGFEDPLCSPFALEAFLRKSKSYNAVVVENGDHAWAQDLPRSIGHLAIKQIKDVLAPKLQPAPSLALAA